MLVVKNIKTQLAELSITRGSVFHSSIFEDIDHGKFFVVMGENENEYVGFFYINSNIHQYIVRKQALLDLQYQLRKVDYPFLKYDSFLCCTEITTMNKIKLSESIAIGKTTIKGSILTEDIDRILSMVRNSKVFSKIQKETFFR